MEEMFNKYKAYIVRAVVGAALALILHWVVDMRYWIVGALIALIAVPVSEFAEKHFDDQMAKAKARKAEKADVEDAEIVDETPKSKGKKS